MQMFTWNVDLNHRDFVPNEAWNVSSELQCPTDKNSPKSLAFVLKRGFKRDVPLKARQFALCHLHKIISKDFQGLILQPPHSAKIPAWALPPGQVGNTLSIQGRPLIGSLWGRIGSVPAWTKGLCIWLGTYSQCKPTKQDAQIIQSPSRGWKYDLGYIDFSFL